MQDQTKDGLFEIDDDGFKMQNKGRPPWALVRELLQNALDSESDVVIMLDTRQRKVVVQNSESSFDNLSDAYTIFGGDKGSNPEKRGRFGRGLKEAVAGCKELTVMTPHGRIKFDVENNQRIKDSRTIDSGTKVIAKNDEWSKGDFEAIKDYVFKLWPPEGQEIMLRLKGGNGELRERWEPEWSPKMFLDTVKVENGVMKDERRRATVHIRRAEGGKGDGRIYEMGIPVNLEMDMPLWVDVQQKVPMAEQRNEADSGFVEQLKPKILNAVYEDLSKKELQASWVESALGSFRIDAEVKEHWANVVLNRPGKGEPVISGNQKANDVVRNYGRQVVDANRLSDGAASAAREAFPSATKVANEIKSGQEERAEPTPDQQRIMEWAEELAAECGYPHVEFQTWKMEDPVDSDEGAPAASHDGSVVKLNVNRRAWEEMSAENLGTIVHEISHEEGRGHNSEWYYAMEENFAQLLKDRM